MLYFIFGESGFHRSSSAFATHVYVHRCFVTKGKGCISISTLGMFYPNTPLQDIRYYQLAVAKVHFVPVLKEMYGT